MTNFLVEGGTPPLPFLGASYRTFIYSEESVLHSHKGRSAMNCYHCKAKLIWGGDQDIDDEDETYSMVTNLSCSECECHVEVYLPKSKKHKVPEILDGLYSSNSEEEQKEIMRKLVNNVQLM